MVLPKEIRERAGIRAGDKLAIVGFQDQGRLCCVSFFKVEELSEPRQEQAGSRYEARL